MSLEEQNAVAKALALEKQRTQIRATVDGSL
jgi:hypothetical protein